MPITVSPGSAFSGLRVDQALFSATFPRTVETLAKKVLHTPLEIIVGGRSVASSDITQHVEIRDENDKFMRLLQVGLPASLLEGGMAYRMLLSRGLFSSQDYPEDTWHQALGATVVSISFGGG